MTGDQPGKTRVTGITQKVYEYFRNHRGVQVHIEDVADAVGFSNAQVAGAVSTLRNGWHLDIGSPRKGWYVFRGDNGAAPVPVKAKAEVVAILDDDRLLLNVEGRLYVARELDV